jgi:hypothetical protein
LYPNQLPDNDLFHDSRIPYISLNQYSSFDKNSPHLINCSEIYQSQVATIAFHKEKNIYHAIKLSNDTLHETNVEKRVIKQDIIKFDDPKCVPSILAFIDVSPENCVVHEKDDIKLEIKSMTEIWIDNELIYDERNDELYMNQNFI